MGNQSGSEKTFFTGKAAINELVNDDKSARRQFLFKRTDSADRNQVGHTSAFERIDVGAVIDG